MTCDFKALANDWASVEDLLAKKDEEREPYKSKYAGRELIKDMLTKVEAGLFL